MCEITICCGCVVCFWIVGCDCGVCVCVVLLVGWLFFIQLRVCVFCVGSDSSCFFTHDVGCVLEVWQDIDGSCFEDVIF